MDKSRPCPYVALWGLNAPLNPPIWRFMASSGVDYMWTLRPICEGFDSGFLSPVGVVIFTTPIYGFQYAVMGHMQINAP